jgi:hypothetical protein
MILLVCEREPQRGRRASIHTCDVSWSAGCWMLIDDVMQRRGLNVADATHLIKCVGIPSCQVIFSKSVVCVLDTCQSRCWFGRAGDLVYACVCGCGYVLYCVWVCLVPVPVPVPVPVLSVCKQSVKPSLEEQCRIRSQQLVLKSLSWMAFSIWSRYVCVYVCVPYMLVEKCGVLRVRLWSLAVVWHVLLNAHTRTRMYICTPSPCGIECRLR